MSKVKTAVWGMTAIVSVGLIVGGVLLLRSTVTCTPGVFVNAVCTYNPLGPWGSWIAVVGVVLLILSLASFSKSWGAWRAYVPEPFGAVHLSASESKQAARAERRAHGILFAAAALVLFVVEAVPIATLYAETTAPPKPTFNPVAFAAVLAVTAVADFLVLFLLHLYLANH